MYKIIKHEEWVKSYRVQHPLARTSPDQTEVVISCRDDNDGDLTASEVIQYIEANWHIEDD